MKRQFVKYFTKKLIVLRDYSDLLFYDKFGRHITNSERKLSGIAFKKLQGIVLRKIERREYPVDYAGKKNFHTCVTK